MCLSIGPLWRLNQNIINDTFHSEVLESDRRGAESCPSGAAPEPPSPLNRTPMAWKSDGDAAGVLLQAPLNWTVEVWKHHDLDDLPQSAEALNRTVLALKVRRLQAAGEGNEVSIGPLWC